MPRGEDPRQHRDRSLESAEEARRRLEHGDRPAHDRALDDEHVPVDEADLTDVREALRRHDRDLAGGG